MISIHVEQPDGADLDVIHGFLTETYWSPGIPLETVQRACEHSVCVIARDEIGALAGFARVISDGATFAWLADVFVLPPHRKQGIAKQMVAALQALPDLQGLRRWMLATRDAHAVYASLGFTPIAAPDRLMQILADAPYGEPYP